MKKNLFILIMIMVASSTFAQQLGVYSQYLYNEIYINPASAGTQKYNPLTVGFRSQWVGLNDAPRMQTAGVHGKIDYNMGLGFSLFNDEAGPVSFAGVQLAYSYHLKINEKANVALGAAGMLYQYVLDKTKLTVNDPDDLALDGGKERSGVKDAAFGALFFTDKLRIGIGAQQLFQDELQYNDIFIEDVNTLVRHYFAHASYLADVSEHFQLQPSGLVKMTDATPVQFDLSLRGTYKKIVSLGFSYRNKESFIIMAGLQKGNFGFGYAYDITLSSIKAYGAGSHELVLRMNIPSLKDYKAPEKDKEEEPEDKE